MPPSTDATRTAGVPVDQHTESPARETGPDDVFALVVGIYAAVVVVPLALAWLTGVLSGAGTLYVTALGFGVAVVAGVAVGVRRVPGLAYRLGATRRRWSLLLAPLAVAAVAGATRVAVAPEASREVTAISSLAAAAGGLFLGTVLATMARTRYTKAVEDRVGTDAEWRGAWPPSRRRLTRGVGVLASVAGIGAFGVSIAVSAFPLRPLGQLLLPGGIVLFMFGQNPRTYRATAAGLVRQLPANRELYDWDRFEGFTVAEDAVVVHFRAPWRFPVICDRESLDGEDQVVDALSAHLPRLPAP
jgi:hypothetical protein